jgi:hypothetical protein
MPAVGLSAQTARKPAGAVHVVQTDFRDPDAPWAVLRALQELSIQSQVRLVGFVGKRLKLRFCGF